jgi:hypothetical protein
MLPFEFDVRLCMSCLDRRVWVHVVCVNMYKLCEPCDDSCLFDTGVCCSDAGVCCSDAGVCCSDAGVAFSRKSILWNVKLRKCVLEMSQIERLNET